MRFRHRSFGRRGCSFCSPAGRTRGRKSLVTGNRRRSSLRRLRHSRRSRNRCHIGRRSRSWTRRRRPASEADGSRSCARNRHCNRRSRTNRKRFVSGRSSPRRNSPVGADGGNPDRIRPRIRRRCYSRSHCRSCFRSTREADSISPQPRANNQVDPRIGCSSFKRSCSFVIGGIIGKIQAIATGGNFGKVCHRER